MASSRRGGRQALRSDLPAPGKKSQLDFPIEIKSGYRYLHVAEVIERGPDVIRFRCSRNRTHTFCREDFSDAAWAQISKGACVSARFADWKLIEINVIGCG